MTALAHVLSIDMGIALAARCGAIMATDTVGGDTGMVYGGT